jgi:hypothetical protein
MNLARLASLPLFASLLALSIAAGCGSTVTTGGTGGGGTGGSGGGGVDFAACDAPGQCVITTATCCGVCGAPELADVVAVNAEHVIDYANANCPDPTACPECATGENPNLYAICESGRCAAKDVRQSEVSACASDSDCVLRFGMGCCEACTGVESDLVSVSVQGFQSVYDALGCAGVPCDACLPQYPMYTVALCNAGGHCEVGFIS